MLVDLNGKWSGQLSFRKYSYWNRSCEDQAIRITLSQTGGSVTGHFAWNCWGQGLLRGTLIGNTFTVRIQGENGAVPSLAGRATSSRIFVTGGSQSQPGSFIAIELSR